MLSAETRRVLDLRLWRHTEAWPVPKGFTRRDDYDMNTVRLGGWVVAFSWQRENVETGERS